MADEVEISNVGGENGVASEATLASLLRATEKMAKASGGGSVEKDIRNLNRARKEAGDSIRENTDARDENTDSVNRGAQATGAFAKAIIDATGSLIGVLGKSIVDLGGQLLSSTTNMSDFASTIPFVGGQLASLVSIFDDSISTFRTLSAVGAGFGNSIETMRKSAAELELGLDEMASFVSANSQALRLLGGTVTDGINNFKAINKSMKDTGDFAALKTLGFTVEEINEGMTDYTSLQSRLGRLQSMDNKQRAAGSARYLEQLDKLAKVTGESREQIAATMAQQAEDAGFRALQNQFEAGSKEFENFRASMAMIDTLPSSVANGLKDLADGIPQTQDGIALLATVGPEIQSAMKNVASGADPQVLIDAISSAGHDIEGFVGGSADQQAAIISQLRQTQPEIAAMLDASTKMRELGTAEYKKAQKEQAERADTTATLTKFDDTLRKFRGVIASAFIDSGIFKTVGDLLGSVATTLEETLASDEFKAKVESFAETIKGWITDLKTFSFSDMFLGLVPKIGMGLIGLFTAGAVISAAKSAVSGLFGKMLGGGGGGAGKGAGKGAGGVIGGMAGGAMKGLAAGLAAFANPAVAIGATVLAGVIAGIGAAIATAAWLTGKALPTFADGMLKFESLDGDKLKAAGAGMLSVADGLAAFGGASIAGGIGSIAGAIGEHFGGSTLDKMKDMAQGMQGIADVKGLKANLDVLNQGLDTDSIKGYADAMERLVEALSEMNEELSKDNKFGFGTGTNAGDVLGQINMSTSGGTEGIERLNSLMENVLVTLQQMQVDTNKTEKNTKNLGGGNIASGRISSIR